MRASKIVTAAAATCALVLLPAASAMAAGAPAAAGERATTNSTAPSEAGNPRSARAQEAEVCSDARQVGSTAYIDRGGVHVASVKQFYSASCNENYGYLWVWDSYRDKVKSYDITVGVYSYDQDATVGKRSWEATHEQEFWSDPADTVADCTSAVGSLRQPGDPAAGSASTDKRC